MKEINKNGSIHKPLSADDDDKGVVNNGYARTEEDDNNKLPSPAGSFDQGFETPQPLHPNKNESVEM